MAFNVTCINFTRSPSPGTYPHFIGNYIFPVVFAVGVCGNILILIVLTRMKIKCKYFLSAMAIADLGFFFTMLVLNLSVFDAFATSQKVVRFCYKAKVTLVVLANWFSSASIWFAIAVTIERLEAIRTPIRARLITWNRKQLAYIILTIFSSTLIFQLPYYLWYEPFALPDCMNPNNTVLVVMQLPLSHQYYNVVRIAMITCPMLIVTIPLMLLIIFNSFLIYFLRLNRKDACEFEIVNHRTKVNERQISVMTCTIVGTFFVFNFPSAVIFVYSLFEKDPQKMLKFAPTALTANYMVTLNKMFNFLLYCCSSAHFRLKLKRCLCGALGRSRRRSSAESNSLLPGKSKTAVDRRQSVGSANARIINETQLNIDDVILI